MSPGIRPSPKSWVFPVCCDRRCMRGGDGAMGSILKGFSENGWGTVKPSRLGVTFEDSSSALTVMAGGWRSLCQMWWKRTSMIRLDEGGGLLASMSVSTEDVNRTHLQHIEELLTINSWGR